MQSARRSPAPPETPNATRREPGPDRSPAGTGSTRSKGKLQRSAHEAVPAQLRVVGELDSDGHHFLIVEAASAEVSGAGNRSPRAKANGRTGPTAIARILTERELQIAALVSAGSLNKQIAVRLAISEYTVSTHIRRIFSKLGIKTRSSLASIYSISQSPARREPPAKKSV